MNNLYFITGNAGKFADAASLIPELKQLDIDLPEIQSVDPREVIQHKLNEASKSYDGNFIVADASIRLSALGGLPGPLIRWFYQTLGNDGIYDLVRRYEDNQVSFVCELGLLYNGEINFFESVLEGRIVEPRGKNGFAWDPIFQPIDADKTFGEMTREEKSEYNTLIDALKKLQIFLENK